MDKTKPRHHVPGNVTYVNSVLSRMLLSCALCIGATAGLNAGFDAQACAYTFGYFLQHNEYAFLSQTPPLCVAVYED